MVRTVLPIGRRVRASQVFGVPGDLTHLAVDAWLLPTDARLEGLWVGHCVTGSGHSPPGPTSAPRRRGQSWRTRSPGSVRNRATAASRPTTREGRGAADGSAATTLSSVTAGASPVTSAP
ncbi:hypothetical protein [Pseudonocardia sp. N23]|uniref:hypothetical protein n=1 Tax=Pseudonocardia sp. N23 TaxID=1987376 RepID=UPI000C03359F|nr:hypothetical protein [Pseudonocardia sp. N23]GAY07481.1 hypothetical protein TOK_3501 [Pseudonocardia sp. N23]